MRFRSISTHLILSVILVGGLSVLSSADIYEGEYRVTVAQYSDGTIQTHYELLTTDRVFTLLFSDASSIPDIPSGSIIRISGTATGDEITVSGGLTSSSP